MRWLTTLAAIMTLWAGTAGACGADTDCMIGDRSYRIALPDGYDGGPVGAIVFAHGYGGSAAGTMRNGSFRRLANDLGVALIAAQGVDGDWRIPGTPHDGAMSGEAEYAYFDALMDDAGARFGVDPDRTLMIGFSAGGMMTWELACRRSTLFAAFMPMSGTFWDPVPETCDGPPASIIHTHGTADTTVPMSGRAIGSARQGDLAAAFEMYGAFGGFETEPTMQTVQDMDCRMRTNDAGQILDLCLFDGGHSFRLASVAWAWERFTELGILAPA